MSGLNWEVRWICRNRHLYRDNVHILEVINNIARRYRRNALIARIKSLRPKYIRG